MYKYLVAILFYNQFEFEFESLLVKSTNMNEYQSSYKIFAMQLLFLVTSFFLYPDHLKAVAKADSINSSPNNLFSAWNNDKKERVALKGVRPIVIHALNEWKRAKLISGKFDVPNGEFYWGPHGLVRRELEIENLPNTPNRNRREIPGGNRPFEAIPTVILEPFEEEDYFSRTPHHHHSTFHHHVHSHGHFSNPLVVPSGIIPSANVNFAWPNQQFFSPGITTTHAQQFVRPGQFSTPVTNNNVQITQVSSGINPNGLLRKPFITDIPRRRFNSEMLREKRSLNLAKLIVDPNAKLDVDKTTVNAGNFFKNSLENFDSPISHFKDLTGSVRDTLVSSYRIIPNDVIIPSTYKIIDKKNPILQQISPNYYLSDVERGEEEITYKKLGDLIRNSVMSTQKTIGHVNDVVHSGRQMIHKGKTKIPEAILKLSKIPELEKRRLFIKQEDYVGATKREEDFLSASEIIDSFGVASSLKEAEERVGATTIKELLKKMKGEKKCECDRDSDDEIVSSAFLTNRNLYKPYMGRIKVEEANRILTNRSRSRGRREVKGAESDVVLGAINPHLYEKYFEEPLGKIEQHHRDPFKEPADVAQGGRKRTFLLKPTKNVKSSRKVYEINEFPIVEMKKTKKKKNSF